MANLTQIEALTSAGLVRRAQKALEKSSLLWNNTTGKTRGFNFEGQQGKFDSEKIELSLCSCPATGICKHIVAAAVFTAQSNEQETTATEYVLPEFNQAELFITAGKVATRSAYRLFSNTQNRMTAVVNIKADHCEIVWQDQRAVIGSELQLDSIIIESRDNNKRLIAALLLLEYQKKSIKWPEWLILELNTKAQEKEQDLADMVTQVKNELFKLANQGISNVKPANLMELAGLIPALKVQGAREIANAISALDEWVGLSASATGLSPVDHILRQMGQLFSLCEGINPKLDISSDKFTWLNLLCVGGHKWSTPSGALGLNMVFLSENGRLFNASILRSQKAGGFSAEQAWSNQILWSGSPINNLLPGQYLKLDNAELNRWGSLGLKADTHYSANQNNKFNIESISDWEKLKELSAFEYALLKPERWTYCEFNELTQSLEIQVEDKHENILSIRQVYTSEYANRISNILDLWKSKPEFIVVRHVNFNQSHQFEPVSIFLDEWVCLDFYTPKKTNLSLLQRLISKFSKNEDSEYLQEVDQGIEGFLRNIEKALQDYPDIDENKIHAFAEQFTGLGLDGLGEKIKDIHLGADSYLKGVYLINAMITIAAPWPIYAKPAD